MNHLKLLLFLSFGFYMHLDAINVKIIPEFIWDRHLGRVAECDIPCEFSANPEKVDAEYYVARGDGDVKSATESNSSNPIKILGSREPQHYYHLLKIEFLKHHFQATSLLDRRSDIPWVLMPNMDSVKKVEKPNDAKPHATFVARNCNPMNNRNEYVKAIDKVIGVFAPSTCFHNMEWPQCKGRVCTKVEAIRDYKIHLAFENGDSPGFITDKIYQAMQAGVLPVWMGTVDVAGVVPNGSYVDVAEFNTPHDVANYLKMLLQNEKLYNSYFEWKHKPFDPEFEEPNRVLWEVEHYCRVCYYVDAIQRGVKWDRFHQRAADRIPENLKETDEKVNVDVINLQRKLPDFEITQDRLRNLSFFWAMLAAVVICFVMCQKVLNKVRFRRILLV